MYSGLKLIEGPIEYLICLLFTLWVNLLGIWCSCFVSFPQPSFLNRLANSLTISASVSTFDTVRLWTITLPLIVVTGA